MSVTLTLGNSEQIGSCMACSRPALRVVQMRLTVEDSQFTTLVRLCEICVQELITGIVVLRYGAD